MKKTSSDEVSIPEGHLVKVKQMNNVLEVRHSSKGNYKPNIKKLDNDTYVEIATGEIKEFQHTENRGQSYNSLRQTFNKIRDLINNGFSGKANELFVTLTLKPSEAGDTKKFYKDFDKFMKRLRYKFKGKSTIDYLTVIEPHASGKWHCHVLMRFNDLESVFIKNSELAQIWGLGYVKIESLKEVDNIGAYLSAYLTDVELTDDNVGQALKADGTVSVKEVDGKKYIKGGRLHMYPPGLNMYRHSKGIVPPEVEEMTFSEVKKIVGAATPNYSKSITLEDEEHVIKHQYLQYNKKRTSSVHTNTENN